MVDLLCSTRPKWVEFAGIIQEHSTGEYERYENWTTFIVEKVVLQLTLMTEHLHRHTFVVLWMWSYLNKTCVFKYCRLYELIMNRSHPKTCKTRLQFHLKGERERMEGRKETITRGAACARAVVRWPLFQMDFKSLFTCWLIVVYT